MTAPEDKLRAALRETADEIPAEAPPLHLPARRPGLRRGGLRVRRARRGWTAWAAPLASAVLVLAVIATSVALTRGVHRPRAANSSGVGLDGLPPYYVALTTQKPDSDIYDLGATAAEVRSTVTGAVLASLTPPRPYVSFTGVTGAADDRTFVLSAQGPNEPFRTYPAQRLFLLHIDPASATPGGRMSLQALPAGYIPAGTVLHDMALSPDGTTLAADIGTVLFNDHLYLFNLATGASRAWSARTCAECFPSSGGLGYGGVNVDALSWTADGQHVAFVWDNTVRLLDTRAAGSNLLADSKPVATWTNGPNANSMWRGAIITPDRRTVLGIEEIASSGRLTSLRERLVTFSAATGRQTAILNDLNVLALSGYEQVLYTDATGSVLIVTFTRPGRNAVILHAGRDTPLPWSPYIGIAAWLSGPVAYRGEGDGRPDPEADVAVPGRGLRVQAPPRQTRGAVRLDGPAQPGLRRPADRRGRGRRRRGAPPGRRARPGPDHRLLHPDRR
jgi:hypothetical protein